jgi:hypothetical protein
MACAKLMINLGKRHTNLAYLPYDSIPMAYELSSYTLQRIVHKIDGGKDESVNDLSACAKDKSWVTYNLRIIKYVKRNLKRAHFLFSLC